jgi:hypothetical protein
MKKNGDDDKGGGKQQQQQQQKPPSPKIVATPATVVTAATVNPLQPVHVVHQHYHHHTTPQHLHATSPLLFDAMCEENFSLAEALIDEDRGLKFVSTVHTNNTVLHAAVIHDAPTKLIKDLLDKGLDPNDRNDMGRSPTYLAARHNVRLSSLKLLVQRGGDLNIRDSYTYTPLMSASYNGGSLTLLQTMIDLGAKLDARDDLGRKPSDWAREGHHEDTAYFLDNVMSSGQKMWQPTKSSETVTPDGGNSPSQPAPIAVHEANDEPDAADVKRAKVRGVNASGQVELKANSPSVEVAAVSNEDEKVESATKLQDSPSSHKQKTIADSLKERNLDPSKHA